MTTDLSQLRMNRDSTVARIARLERDGASIPQLEEQREHLAEVTRQIARLTWSAD